MNGLAEVVPSIYRLVVPFEDIYTTVFIIKSPLGAVLLDTATYAGDVDGYILPALDELSVAADALQFIVLSHGHRDHAGGLERLMDFFPDACIVSSSEGLRRRFAHCHTVSPETLPQLLDCIDLIPVPGHAPDCLVLYDRRSRTLLTGDSLQLFGIYGSGKWGANISKPAEHLDAVERLRSLPLAAVIASHDYHPCGYIARSPEEISRYFDSCKEALVKISRFIVESPDDDDQSLAERYNQAFGLPTVGSHVFSAVRAANLT